MCSFQFTKQNMRLMFMIFAWLLSLSLACSSCMFGVLFYVVLVSTSVRFKEVVGDKCSIYSQRGLLTLMPEKVGLCRQSYREALFS